MSPLGWNPPHIVDRVPALTTVLFFFCFLLGFFLSICLSLCQSVCVSVHLLTINLKFLKTHNYWLPQLLYMSLVSGLELKNCKLCIKMLRNFSKKNKQKAIVLGFGSKQPLQQHLLVLLDLPPTPPPFPHIIIMGWA